VFELQFARVLLLGQLGTCRSVPRSYSLQQAEAVCTLNLLGNTKGEAEQASSEQTQYVFTQLRSPSARKMMQLGISYRVSIILSSL